MEGFSFGDLGQRVKFFASPLYRDYVETRSRARLLAMQQADTKERREELLTSLVASAEHLEGDAGQLQQHAGWARGLFSAAVAPATRLSFSLASDPAERVEFACQFKVLPSDTICWPVVRCAAALVEVPKDLAVDDFLHMLALVHEGGARKSVVNPLVGALCDFQAEVLLWSGSSASVWLGPLMQAVGAAKMGVPRWQVEDFAPDIVPDEYTPALSKALGRLFALKPPQWVVSLREKVADRKVKQAAAAQPVGFVFPVVGFCLQFRCCVFEGFFARIVCVTLLVLVFSQTLKHNYNSCRRCRKRRRRRQQRRRQRPSRRRWRRLKRRGGQRQQPWGLQRQRHRR